MKSWSALGNSASQRKRFTKKGEWNKFFGDFANRIVIGSLSRHLPKEYVAIGSCEYVKAVPSEFDILIVKSGTKPEKFTNAFPRDLVLVAIEVKKRCGSTIRDLLLILRECRSST